VALAVRLADAQRRYATVKKVGPEDVALATARLKSATRLDQAMDSQELDLAQSRRTRDGFTGAEADR
jgi:hypothetical protein